MILKVASTEEAWSATIEPEFHRVRIARYLVVSVMLVVTGILGISMQSSIGSLIVPIVDSMESDVLRNQYTALIAATGGLAILLGVGLLLFFYLRYGSSFSVNRTLESSSNAQFEKLDVERTNTIAEAINSIESRITRLEDQSSDSAYVPTQEERTEVIAQLRKHLEKEGVKEILQSVEDKLVKQKDVAHQLDFLRRRYGDTKSRLSSEIENLGRRGNVNLIIGSMTAIVGLLILGYLVFPGTNILSASIEMSPSGLESLWTSMGGFLPRLSLIVLIEIFAYFFLRLYKSNLQEIKYYQNELTNAESKFAALEGAVATNDIDSIRSVLEVFSTTERNFVLEKGQSTVELERSKIDNTKLKEAFTAMAGVIKPEAGKKEK